MRLAGPLSARVAGTTLLLVGQEPLIPKGPAPPVETEAKRLTRLLQKSWRQCSGLLRLQTGESWEMTWRLVKSGGLAEQH